MYTPTEKLPQQSAVPDSAERVLNRHSKPARGSGSVAANAARRPTIATAAADAPGKVLVTDRAQRRRGSRRR